MAGLDWIPYAAAAASVATGWGVTLIAMKNWRGDKYLCDNCLFNNEADCKKPERPRALKCTVYRSTSVDGYQM